MMGRWLEHPLARGCDIDAPETTHLRKQLIRSKPFLRSIYEDWYGWMAGRLPSGPGRVVEIGSGAGFLNERIPGLIASDVFSVPGLSLVLDACRLPFQTSSLKAVLMTNVLHHIPRPREFFHEAARAVRPGGAILMVEPWKTRWSQWVYTHLHHEPFDPEAGWEFPASGPLSGANGALPWILFERDRERFAAEFPTWNIEAVALQMPFRYLLSGGMSYRAFLPGFAYRLAGLVETGLRPWNRSLAMFAGIVLRRTQRSG